MLKKFQMMSHSVSQVEKGAKSWSSSIRKQITKPVYGQLFETFLGVRSVIGGRPCAYPEHSTEKRTTFLFTCQGNMKMQSIYIFRGAFPSALQWTLKMLILTISTCLHCFLTFKFNLLNSFKRRQINFIIKNSKLVTIRILDWNY